MKTTRTLIPEIVAGKGGFCPHFIGGEFTPSVSGARFQTIAPASEEVLADVALGDEADVAAAVAAARAAFEEGPWPRLSVASRADILRRLADLIMARRDELARLESLDTGKPLSETYHGDIPRAAANFRFFADLAVHQPAASYQNDHDGQIAALHTTFREPLGVCGLITPWNLPLYLETWKLAPALVQGNTVVLKPAELTPLSAYAFADIAAEAGLPPGVFNLVQGFGAQGAGAALVRHPDVRAISFTGETTTGVAIMQAAAAGLKKLSFELGGKGASVVFADADLAAAVPAVARAAFRNQGQICLAGSRLIVEESIADRFLELLLAAVKAIRIGDPLAKETTMGALISAEHRAKVLSYIELAQSQGRILCGGKIPAGLTRGYYLEPTVIAGIEQSSRLIQEEIFGPVLTVQTFKSTDEALSLLNGTPYGLSCSVWSQSQGPAIARRARMGLVWINSWFLRDLHTAFGGMKRSGVGREGGVYSLDFFSELKTVTTPMT